MDPETKLGLVLLLCGLILLGGVYLTIVDFVWQWRNPTANSVQILTHFGDALRFRALPQFQGNKE